MLYRRRVMIVEDEPMIAACLVDEIEVANGEAMGPFATVAEALLILERNEVHAAILDVNLADRDVIPVAERLLSAGTPVVFHTGSVIPDEITARYGAVVVCAKPSAPAAVVRILARMIGP